MKALIGLSICAAAAQAALLVLGHAYLYADGAFYLYQLLLTSAPLDIDFGRHFAHLATQWPAVAAVRAGVTNIETLSLLLGVGLYGPQVASLVACVWIARHRPELALFPIVSAAAGTANSSFFIVSESHLVAALFWPLLFLLILVRRWSPWTFLAAGVLAFPMLRAYESMALAGPVLAGCAGFRAFTAPDRVRRWAFALLAIYCVAGSGVAVYFILNPRIPGNYDSFVESLRFYRDDQGHWHWLGAVSAGTVVLMMVSLLRPFPVRTRAAFLAIVIGAAAAAALLPLFEPMSVAPYLHYRARVVNVYLPPVLGVVFLTCAMSASRARNWSLTFAVAATLSLAQLCWHAAALREWRHYLDVFRIEVTTHRGLVPFGESALAKEAVSGRPIAAMNWDWIMPTMSILLAPDGNVRAIVDNPPYEGWLPFDQHDATQLPDLSRYGVRYGDYLAALEHPDSPAEETR